jgi:hypothetical protein
VHSAGVVDQSHSAPIAGAKSGMRVRAVDQLDAVAGSQVGHGLFSSIVTVKCSGGGFGSAFSRT